MPNDPSTAESAQSKTESNKRQNSASIRQRLIGSLLLILMIFLGLTGFALNKAFQTSLETAAEEKLKTQVYALLGVMNAIEEQLVFPESLPDPAFNQLNSGLFAQVADADGQILWRSSSSVGKSLPSTQSLAAGVHRFQSQSPELFLYQFGIIWEFESGQSQAYTISLFQDKTPFIKEVKGFQRTLWLWLAGITLTLLLTQWLIIRWGLSPLSRLSHELEGIEKGEQSHLTDDYPAELHGVTHNLNLLIQQERRRQDRYRTSLADLAHSLKTPLAVLRSELAAQDKSGQQSDEQIQAIDQAIAYHLQRANRSEPGLTVARQNLEAIAGKLLRSLDKVYQDKDIKSQLIVTGQTEFQIDAGDLTELLGNLLDNAFKAAQQTVQVECQASESQLIIHIDDDGPGLPEEEHPRILARGGRADTYAAGQGIGLAIVMDIIRSYRGNLNISTSSLGGARFSIKLNTL